MNLLTTGNPKILKGQSQGFLTSILHLAPADLSGYEVCPKRSKGCTSACLNKTGRGGIIKKGESTNRVQEARIRRTKLFFENRGTFMTQIVSDVERTVKYATKKNLVPVFRLNGTSDLSWHKYSAIRNGITYTNIFTAFPEVQFYDYTAVHRKPSSIPNYHLTFSRKESNDFDTAIALSNGMNVAVVFQDKLPSTYKGRPVIDGTETDLRFLDPKGVIVGLLVKGFNDNKKRAIDSGFAIAA